MSESAVLQLDLPLHVEPEAELPARLHRLGLPGDIPVVLTRNRTVLVSWAPRLGLRLHAGYAWAGDDVLVAILEFIRPNATRATRLAARNRFLRFPVEQHASSRARRRSTENPEHAPFVERLGRLHQILNERHFGGGLRTISVRLSDRMKRCLGEYRTADHGGAPSIVLSRRHLRRDGWSAAADTLLHEMIHQWQHETGRTLDHGPEFRRKARAVGISPRATEAC